MVTRHRTYPVETEPGQTTVCLARNVDGFPCRYPAKRTMSPQCFRTYEAQDGKKRDLMEALYECRAGHKYYASWVRVKP